MLPLDDLWLRDQAEQFFDLLPPHHVGADELAYVRKLSENLAETLVQQIICGNDQVWAEHASELGAVVSRCDPGAARAAARAAALSSRDELGHQQAF
jgi:hypothetical protein